MKPIPGARPSEVTELPRIRDRMSFVYLERCIVHRDGNALTATDHRGTVHLPTASIGAVLLGPGTRASHQAMVVMADSGTTAVWVGEHGVRYYCHGRSLSRSSRWLVRQAEIVSNQSRRLEVARAMYAMRFPGEDVSGLTMQQLRGREGARVRLAYREAAERTGVQWKRRDYRPDDFESSDLVNQALSAATTCLYGLVHAVVVALGFSPALGVVHTGHDRSFVYDVADLYKVEFAVPAAFEVAATETEDPGGDTRRLMRDLIRRERLLERVARDVQSLLGGDDSDADVVDVDLVELWDGGLRSVAGGVDYGPPVPW